MKLLTVEKEGHSVEYYFEAYGAAELWFERSPESVGAVGEDCGALQPQIQQVQTS